MNNSAFGKTMANFRKQMRVDLVRASENDSMYRLVAYPAYVSRKIFDGDLVAIRPIYVGRPVLDNSKLLMYDFWYNQIKADYGAKASLFYTDTDSVLLHVQTEDA